ncbi:Nif3-like dinuclear metal center hexameric protein [Alteromonas sp. 5E99-2]|uniref:Nif3-like dinuclear metal center hexameric protein n=1 Tax=Alteromonas sp. 5E99-2 TaxID=2817683 RepID=UPI001A991E86|nr:Nif3-like dinuclear metal center hexameric protein [Alteromonas sp. 5E99-2]MBO1255527.1 Nif3-like dinuclear metal center hexameric protein [Alteromonas sp. 5E99-2]
MGLLRKKLLSSIDSLLKPKEIKDFCPNGLQIQGTDTINKIVSGVTASQALIDAAIDVGADTILVHHGYFWKGESQPLVGMKYKRIKSLLDNNVNLIAYHLPLDVHPLCGNNAQLGKLLQLDDVSPVSDVKPNGIVYSGSSRKPLSGKEVKCHLESSLERDVLWVGSDSPIRTLAWCTGGGQGYIDAAVEAGVDAFITGEVSEQTVHIAREMGIHFFCAGHHATERYGVKALGEWIAENHDVDVQFIDIPNPA